MQCSTRGQDYNNPQVKSVEMNPKDINFAQSTINKSFDTPDGKVSIEKAIRNGPGQVENFPPINVINVKGQYVARDGNSRLYIAQKTKALGINVAIETDINSLRDLNKRLKSNYLGNMGTPKLPTPK